MVLHEIKKLPTNPGAIGDAPSDDPDVRTVPAGTLESYLNKAVTPSSLPAYAPFVGITVPRTRSFLLTQLQLFSYAAGRDLTEKECSILVRDDLASRRTSANIMTGAVSLGLIQLYRAHRNQWPLPLQSRFPANYQNINTFGNLKGPVARAAWSSLRFAVYLPLWVVGAQIVVLPLMGLQAMRASKDEDLRKMNEEVRRGLMEKIRRGSSMPKILKESESWAKRSRGTGTASMGGWADGPADGGAQDGETAEMMMRRGISGGADGGGASSSSSFNTPRPFQDRWTGPAARSGDGPLDDLIDGSGEYTSQPYDPQSPKAQPRDLRPSERRSWDQVRGVARAENRRGGGGAGAGAGGGGAKGWDQPDSGFGGDSSSAAGGPELDQASGQSWQDIRRQALAAKGAVDARRDE